MSSHLALIITNSQFIHRDPSVLGGTAVVSGSRVPVSRILYLMQEAYTPEMIQSEYPFLSTASIHGIISEIKSSLDAPVDDKAGTFQATT